MLVETSLASIVLGDTSLAAILGANVGAGADVELEVVPVGGCGEESLGRGLGLESRWQSRSLEQMVL